LTTSNAVKPTITGVYGLQVQRNYLLDVDANPNLSLTDVPATSDNFTGVSRTDLTLTDESLTINENGELVVRTNQVSVDNFKTWLTTNNTDVTIRNAPFPELIEDYVDLDDKRDTRPITCVELGFKGVEGNPVRKDDDLIALYGENWLRIYDNPFAYSTEKQDELIDAIFNQVKGLGYSAFESKYAFKPYLQLGDLIQFKNKNGNLVNSLILKIDTDYDDITLSAPSIVNAAVEYEQPQTALSIAKKASIKVDQANSEITLLVQTTNTHTGQIAENTTDIETTNAQLSIIEGSIIAQVEASLSTKAEQGEVDVLKSDMTTLQQTASDLSLDITKINDDGVSKVTTTTGFKFDEDGLSISKTGQAMSALVDNTGLYVNRNEDNVLTVNDVGVQAENMTVRNYFIINERFRVEDYGTGIGFFFIGED
jgi:hypothetical protein